MRTSPRVLLLSLLLALAVVGTACIPTADGDIAGEWSAAYYDASVGAEVVVALAINDDGSWGRAYEAHGQVFAVQGGTYHRSGDRLRLDIQSASPVVAWSSETFNIEVSENSIVFQLDGCADCIMTMYRA